MTTPYSEPWEGKPRPAAEQPDPAPDLKARSAAQALDLVDQELIAMREVYQILRPLKPAARERVLRWALDGASPTPGAAIHITKGGTQ